MTQPSSSESTNGKSPPVGKFTLKDEKTGNGWRAMLGDSCERIKEIEENSIGLSVFSPPFPGMYAYTNSPRDIGNCKDFKQLLAHFGVMMPEIAPTDTNLVERTYLSSSDVIRERVVLSLGYELELPAPLAAGASPPLKGYELAVPIQ